MLQMPRLPSLDVPSGAAPLLLALLALSPSPAAASDHGYLGDGQPWIVGAGVVVQRASDRLQVGGSVRFGHRLGDVGDVRVGLDVGKGFLAPFGEVLLVPVDFGRLNLGVSVATGLRREDGVNAFFVRAAPFVAFRPFAVHEQPVCHGCPTSDDHSPLQLELGLPEVEGRFGGGTSSLAWGASLRVALRF